VAKETKEETKEGGTGKRFKLHRDSAEAARRRGGEAARRERPSPTDARLFSPRYLLLFPFARSDCSDGIIDVAASRRGLRLSLSAARYENDPPHAHPSPASNIDSRAYRSPRAFFHPPSFPGRFPTDAVAVAATATGVVVVVVVVLRDPASRAFSWGFRSPPRPPRGELKQRDSSPGTFPFPASSPASSSSQRRSSSRGKRRGECGNQVFCLKPSGGGRAGWLAEAAAFD